MFKTALLGLSLSFILATGFAYDAKSVHAQPSSAGAACLTIGGLGMANFAPQKDGTSTIVAPLSGTFGTAAGKITGQRKTATGLEMDMEHYFMTKEGGFLLTKDLGILTPVVGKKDHYMIEITYDIQEKTTSGPLEGFKGGFKSYGLVDLKNLQGLVRYSGKICK